MFDGSLKDNDSKTIPWISRTKLLWYSVCMRQLSHDIKHQYGPLIKFILHQQNLAFTQQEPIFYMGDLAMKYGYGNNCGYQILITIMKKCAW